MAVHSLLSLEPTQFPRPEEYIPERWLRGNTEFPSAKKAHPFTYMPFGFGPRSCIGRRFSEMEVETLILTVRKLSYYWQSSLRLLSGSSRLDRDKWTSIWNNTSVIKKVTTQIGSANLYDCTLNFLRLKLKRFVKPNDTLEPRMISFT
jgi:hypothetical protein